MKHRPHSDSAHLRFTLTWVVPIDVVFVGVIGIVPNEVIFTGVLESVPVDTIVAISERKRMVVGCRSSRVSIIL